MIYSGYQGIGKSTLCKNDRRFIDLESSNFFIDGKRDENWYKVYANIAKDLSDSGFNVFIASHKILREYLNTQNIPFVAIHPSLELKELWIKKLEKRYLEETKLEKHYKAWKNAEQMYEENIKDMAAEKNSLAITDINYTLYDVIFKNK